MAQPLKIQYRPIEGLIPYARNSRTHSDEQVGQIAGSIKEFGFTNPVLIAEDGGIIAGHGRVMAASRLKLAEVPTITLDGLTPAQKRAYIIADNRLPLNAGWDFEMLAVELDELRDAAQRGRRVAAVQRQREGAQDTDTDLASLVRVHDAPRIVRISTLMPRVSHRSSAAIMPGLIPRST